MLIPRWPEALRCYRELLLPRDAGQDSMACGSIEEWSRPVGTGSSMALTYIAGTVRGANGKTLDVRFLVDSGATYTLLPYEVWQTLGLMPRRSVTFTLADGTTIQRPVAECYLVLPQGEAHTPVILGQPGDEALLGAVTLEILGLVLNPFTRELQPMRMLLA